MEQESDKFQQRARNTETVSMNDMPLAIGCILDDVAEIRTKLDYLCQKLGIVAVGMKPVTLKEAAEFLSISERSLKKMVKEQSIPYYERNGKIYFFEKELLEWIKEKRVEPLEVRIPNYYSLNRNRR